MNDRLEANHPCWMDGQAGRLYASLGRRDDYLEIEIPSANVPRDSLLDRLHRIPLETSQRTFDVKLREGEPPSLCVLVWYASDAWDDTGTPQGRLAQVLAELQAAAPELEFGDLLPSSRVAPAMVPAPVSGTTITATGPTVQAPDPAHDMLAARDLLTEAQRLAGQGHTCKAIRAAEAALRHRGASIDAATLLGQLRVLEQREKRRKKQPRSSQAALEAGFSYLTVGSHRKAVEALEQACRLDKEAYLAQVLLGMALHRGGQPKAARRAYQAAIQMRPDEGVPRQLLLTLSLGQEPPLLEEAVSSPQPAANRGHEAAPRGQRQPVLV